MAVIFGTYMLCQILSASTNNPTVFTTYEPTVEPTVEPTITLSTQSIIITGSLDYTYTKTMFITLALESQYMTFDIIDIIEDELELKSSVGDNLVLADIYDYTIRETEPRPNITRYDIRINITINAIDPITFAEAEFIDITSIEDQIEDLDLSGNDIDIIVLNIDLSWDSADIIEDKGYIDELLDCFNWIYIGIFGILILCWIFTCCACWCFKPDQAKKSKQDKNAKARGYRHQRLPQLDPEVTTNTTEPTTTIEDRIVQLATIPDDEPDHESDDESDHESDYKPAQVILHEAQVPDTCIDENMAVTDSDNHTPEPEEAKESQTIPIVVMNPNAVHDEMDYKDPDEDVPDMIRGASDVMDELHLKGIYKEICREKSNASDHEVDYRQPRVNGFKKDAMMRAVSDPNDMIVHSSTSLSPHADTKGTGKAGEPSVVFPKGHVPIKQYPSNASMHQYGSEGKLKMLSDHNM